MYKIQLVSVVNKKLLREIEDVDLDYIHNFIESWEDPNREEGYILDYALSMHESKYFSHTITKDKKDTIYRLFFKTKMLDSQLQIQ